MGIEQHRRAETVAEVFAFEDGIIDAAATAVPELGVLRQFGEIGRAHV